MKEVCGIKLEIFLLIFSVGSILISFFLINYTASQISCNETNYLYTGYLESPIFDFGTSTNITKFLWKGYEDIGSFVKFTLYGGSDINLPQSKEIVTNPSVIYISTSSDQPYILSGVRYLKYRVDFYKCDENSIPRVDQIYIYYSY